MLSLAYMCQRWPNTPFIQDIEILQMSTSELKRHNQAKIIKISVFLFRLLLILASCPYIRLVRPYMSKIRNTGITDKWGFRHTCYVATAAQYLKDFRNSILWTCSNLIAIIKRQAQAEIIKKSVILFWLFNMTI